MVEAELCIPVCFGVERGLGRWGSARGAREQSLCQQSTSPRWGRELTCGPSATLLGAGGGLEGPGDSDAPLAVRVSGSSPDC